MEEKEHLLSARANLAFVVRGPMDHLTPFWEDLERLCQRHRLKIAFKMASASRLWIKEDEDARSTG